MVAQTERRVTTVLGGEGGKTVLVGLALGITLLAVQLIWPSTGGSAWGSLVEATPEALAIAGSFALLRARVMRRPSAAVALVTWASFVLAGLAVMLLLYRGSAAAVGWYTALVAGLLLVVAVCSWAGLYLARRQLHARRRRRRPPTAGGE